MNKERRDKDFKELESRAVYCLSHPEELEPINRQMRAVYRLWHYPSFGDYKSWLVFLPLRDIENPEFTISREVTWRREIDAQRFTNPSVGLQMGFHTKPSLEVVDVIVNLKDLNEQLEKLDNIEISISPISKIIGLNGEMYGFQDLNPLQEICLEWWSTGPREWAELISWAAGMREFLENHFRKSELIDA
ncbi:MAG: hypothetical protein L0220_08905 [Acidobacteria bacterium]|nr:hypothetical protein [Acidobacteriota bacterium]